MQASVLTNLFAGMTGVLLTGLLMVGCGEAELTNSGSFQLRISDGSTELSISNKEAEEQKLENQR